MSYSITMSGHAHSEAAERKLHARLAEVTQEDPEYGVASSHFGGHHVQGTIHLHHHAETEHVHERDSD